MSGRDPQPSLPLQAVAEPRCAGGRGACEVERRHSGHDFPVAGRVRFGVLVPRGAHSPEVLRRIIQRHINELRFCYEQELVRTPKLQGTMTVKLEIASIGKVTTATVTESTLGNTRIAACSVAAFERWPFPGLEGGGDPTRVNVPVTFELADGT